MLTFDGRVCGANSDLFGRRYFILSGTSISERLMRHVNDHSSGHLFAAVGAIVGGTSHSMTQTIVAHVLLGFGSGNCQLCAFAIPELLPNRWRHIGVVIADGVTFFSVIAGPVTARVSITSDSWRWGYWAELITLAISFAVLAVWYFPPKHPRGIPWDEALRRLDWVGIVTFTLSAAMILSGIVYVQLLPSNDLKVIGLLVAGFAALVLFSLWYDVQC